MFYVNLFIGYIVPLINYLFLRLDRKVNKDKEKSKEEVCSVSQKHRRNIVWILDFMRVYLAF